MSSNTPLRPSPIRKHEDASLTFTALQGTSGTTNAYETRAAVEAAESVKKEVEALPRIARRRDSNESLNEAAADHLRPTA